MQDKAPFLSSRKSLLLLSGVVVIFALSAGWWFTQFVTRNGDDLERSRVEFLASTAAASLNASQVASLLGNAKDVGTPAFNSLRSQLKRVHDVNPDLRFVYLMRPSIEHPKQMIFIADAEPMNSADYSAPGDLYDGPSSALFSVYQTGKPAIEYPYHDRWGHWVTSVAPITDEKTGKVIAVLGMDVNADSWLATHARYRNFAIATASLLTLLALVFLLGLYWQEQYGERIARQLLELEQVQVNLRLADMAVKHTGEGIIVLDADLNIQSVNPSFENITGYLATEVLGASPQLLEAPENEVNFFQQIRSSLQSGDHWSGTLSARRKNGDTYPMAANVDVVHAEDGKVLHHVVVFHDATAQKQLENRLRALSATDGLTLVANRRMFNEVMEREWHRATRNHEPVSLIMADIDMFKKYNDIYGHLAGDECLRSVAQTISDSAQRGSDLVARYGGEEFAVILPNTDEATAKEIAEKIRLRIEALKITHAGSTVSSFVTISLGIATRIPPQESDLLTLMESADKALYRAKDGGRNRVAT